jgi:FMN-dependent NADH-azoreductase
MRILNIVTSPRGERSASIAIADSFLFEYKKEIKGLVVDTLDVWTESLPEFGAEAIGAKYKGVSGEPMTPSERAHGKRLENWRHALKRRIASCLVFRCGIFPFLIN